MTLPESGAAPEDRRVQIMFGPVGRVVASLRNGWWDDPVAQVVPFGIDELLSTVQSFGGVPIYGSEYIDVHEKQLQQIGNRVSLNWASGNDGVSHSITVFQESNHRHLDLLVWFDGLLIRDPSGKEIPLDVFIPQECGGGTLSTRDMNGPQAMESTQHVDGWFPKDVLERFFNGVRTASPFCLPVDGLEDLSFSTTPIP